MYIKWQSYVARHHKDFRIAGTIAMLKWVDKTDKGWDYMKALIEKEIAKKYPKKGFKNKMAKGGELIKRADGSYSKRGLWDNIRANIGSGKKPTKEMLEQEVKIRSKMQTGGVMESQPPANFENVLYKELANRYKHGGNIVNNTCIEELVNLIKTHSEIKYWIVDKNTNNLVIVFKEEIGVYDIEIYNKFLNGLTECNKVFDKEVEIQYDNDEYKTIFIKLKTIDFDTMEMEYGGGVKDIRCKCGWGWNKNQSEKHDEYVCHKCGTDNKMKDGGVVGKKFQKNLDELLKEEGWNVSYYDKNINNVPKEKAYQISLSKFHPYYENISIKLPSKMEVTFEWIMNKVSKDKVYKSFSENFSKILKSKGIVNINAYPTTYGIGIFVFAGTKIPETKKNIENLLNSLGIIYTTEYSDANLVFRYKISKSKENIEKIEQIENKMQTGGMMEGQPPANFENVLYTQLANRYKDGGTTNSELIEKTLNMVSNGEINSDDAAIQLDESGIEVDEDLYDKLRDAEKTFLNKNKGLQVGDIITVKGKNGNQDFKGNFRGFTNDGKLIVVYEGGNQMMIGKDDYYKNGGELAKGIKVEKEHQDTYKKLYNREITPEQAPKYVATDHLKNEDPKYYSKMQNIDFDKHYDEIKTKYAGGGSVEPTYTLNTPSGDKSRLTYLQQVLVRTTAFKNFFGDWETAAKNYLADNKENFKEHFKNVSKVMDMSVLEPRAVFHGTKTDEEFFMFDVTKQKGVGRPYAYFAHNKQYSENFTDYSNRAHDNGKPFLYECFLNIRNPFRAEGDRYETKTKDYEYWLNTIIGTIAWDKYSTIQKNSKTKNLEEAVNSQIEKYLSDKANGQDIPFWNYMARDTKSEFKYFLISYGYDGIFYSEEYSSVYDVNNPKQYTKAVCVFTANDIKLANGKNLNFDPMTADIRYEEGGVPTPNTNGVTEHNMTAKDKLGSLLFGDKYAKGGTAKYEEEIIPMQQDQSSNNRKFVDELIKKMKK
jgi:hypothetical protein